MMVSQCGEVLEVNNHPAMLIVVHACRSCYTPIVMRDTSWSGATAEAKC